MITEITALDGVNWANLCVNGDSPKNRAMKHEKFFASRSRVSSSRQANFRGRDPIMTRAPLTLSITAISTGFPGRMTSNSRWWTKAHVVDGAHSRLP